LGFPLQIKMDNINNLEIIDNFLSIEDWKAIHDAMLGEDFPWFFHSDVADVGENLDHYYFSHVFYWQHAVNSAKFNILTPLMSKINPAALIRVKGNLYPNLNKPVVNNKHIDMEYKHRGAIYYINTNNGKTILEDGTEIDSVANRIVFFDSFRPHSSTHCTDEKVRININLNFF
jgi:hypothetical protein